MKIFLTTKRLILRQFTPDDLDNLVVLDSDPEVMRFINGGIPSSYETIAKTFLPDVLSYYERYENFGFWAIIEKSSQQFIGWTVLRPESRFKIAKLMNAAESNTAELGYRLRRASWNQGYATEACQILIDRGFTEWNLEKIAAWALPENKASIKVMTKLGFQLQQEYILTAEDILPNIKLLESPVIQNLLDRKLVKYQRTRKV